MNPIQQAISALEDLLTSEDFAQAERYAREVLTSLRSLNKEVEGVELPPLPEPYTELYKDLTPVLYEAWSQQLHAYARTAIAAALGRGATQPEKWIDDPHDIEQGRMLNPEWLKAHGLTAAKATQPTQAEDPSEVTDEMALAFHRALTDGSIGSDEVEEIKIGLRAALATQQAGQGEAVALSENPITARAQVVSMRIRAGDKDPYRPGNDVSATPPATGAVERDREDAENYRWLYEAVGTSDESKRDRVIRAMEKACALPKTPQEFDAAILAKQREMDAKAEPMGHVLHSGHGDHYKRGPQRPSDLMHAGRYVWTPVYAHPPAAQDREPMTDEQRSKLIDRAGANTQGGADDVS